MALFVAYKKEHQTGSIFAVTALALIGGSLIIANNNPNRMANGFALGSYIGGFSFYFIALHHAKSAGKHLSKAVWLRNRDVLLK
jgi:ethanolamine transporter EutH